jgi:glycosyltransferase involved in cell wall biosynthesis
MGESTRSITLCIPVYNAMPHLPDTLASVLNQTFRDFNILIVDDGSTDDSYSYLKDFVQEACDPRITLTTQKNQGLTATLNGMLKTLGSGWMVRQDADDIALPNRLERIWEMIQQFPNAGMIYSHAGHFQGGSLKGRLLTTPPDETGLRSFLKRGFLPAICHPSVALRVEAALSIGGYRFDLHVEDYDLYWRVGLQYDVYMIPEVLLGYRMTSASVSDQNSQKQATNVLYVQYLLLSELWQKKSASYADVMPVLERMVDTGHLKFRSLLRSAMVRYGQRRYGAFALQLLRAFSASPTSFVARFLRQNSQIAKVGISPNRFRDASTLLWPNP